MKLRNKYYILRHGEAVSNVREVCSSWPEKFKNPLTQHGKEMILASAEILKANHAQHGNAIDMIFTSPLLRTKQTAQIVAKELNVAVKFDKRLREVSFGILNSKSIGQLNGYFKSEKERVKKKMPRGESYQEVVKRVYSFVKDADKKYKGKNILIVSHEGPLWMLESKIKGMTLARALDAIPKEGERIHRGEIRVLNSPS